MDTSYLLPIGIIAYVIFNCNIRKSIARFSVLWHKKGAIAPVDYLSTFATAPLITFLIVFVLIRFPNVAFLLPLPVSFDDLPAEF